MHVSRAGAFYLSLLSFICCSKATEWTKQYSVDELFLKFRYDPHCPGWPQGLKEKPERIEQLALNFEKAKVCFEKMGLKNPVDYWTVHYCYRFAYCYEDPLAHRYMNEIAALPKEQKSYVMNQDVEILDTRRMFVDLLRWKAEKKYEEAGIEPALRAKLLDIIWYNRYHFANFMNDHWIDCIIDDLPEKQEIPQSVKELMVVRYYQMREFLDKHHMIRLPQTERAAYEVLGLLSMDASPDDIIRYLLNYSAEADPIVYGAFFNNLHVNKINTYNEDILVGIDIYDEIALERCLSLRYQYETFLLQTCKTAEQRAIIRASLKLIMYACRQPNIEPYVSLIEQVLKAYTSDVDKTILSYPKVLRAVQGKPEQCSQLVTLLEQVHEAPENDPGSRGKLIHYIVSVI